MRHALDHVDQNDVGQFLIGDAHRAIGADVAGAHNRNFLSQCKLLGGEMNFDYSGMRVGLTRVG